MQFKLFYKLADDPISVQFIYPTEEAARLEMSEILKQHADYASGKEDLTSLVLSRLEADGREVEMLSIGQ